MWDSSLTCRCDTHANSTVITLKVPLSRPVAVMNSKSLSEVIQAEKRSRQGRPYVSEARGCDSAGSRSQEVVGPSRGLRRTLTRPAPVLQHHGRSRTEPDRTDGARMQVFIRHGTLVRRERRIQCNRLLRRRRAPVRCRVLHQVLRRACQGLAPRRADLRCSLLVVRRACGKTWRYTGWSPCGEHVASAASLLAAV